MRELRRTSHWSHREDSVVVFVKNQRVVVQDAQNILFHDCGDRVALLLLLALRPPPPPPDPNAPLNACPAPPAPPLQQFVAVNTHLLFPHNEWSSKIRLREMTKILGFVETYKQLNLCAEADGACSRSDVRLPVIIAGDFNGAPRGIVCKFVRSQNFLSAMEEDCRRRQLHPLDADSGPDELEHESTAANAPERSLSPRTRWTSWVSHRSHLGKNVAVDHVCLELP
jgi:hypothetical protein